MSCCVFILLQLYNKLAQSHHHPSVVVIRLEQLDSNLAKISTKANWTVFGSPKGPLPSGKNPLKSPLGKPRKVSKTENFEITCKRFVVVRLKSSFRIFCQKFYFSHILHIPKFPKTPHSRKKYLFLAEIWIFKVKISYEKRPLRKQILTFNRHIESPYHQIFVESGLKTSLDYPEQLSSNIW